MSLVLSVGRNREKAIDLIELVLKEFCFGKISFANQKLTMTHLAQMRAQPGDMDLQCQLLTGEDGQTQIKIDCTFKKGLVTQ